MSDKILEYKCPCCGGAIEFNSDVQKMKCPYCDTEFEMDQLKPMDRELDDSKADDEDEMKWYSDTCEEWNIKNDSDVKVYICKSCGGEIIADKNTAATSCPYCSNPVVLSEQVSGAKKPDCVIPFKLDKEAAKEGMKKHLMGKRLLPKVFKDENHIDEIKGIYVPFWLFDADANAEMRYVATNIRTWSDSKYNYKDTSFYLVERDGKIKFTQVPVDGSTKMPDDLMESIEPFDMSEAVDFQTAYLAGYFADKYDVTSNESIKRANDRIKESTERIFRRTVKGYSTVVQQSKVIRLNNGAIKYALYPVWILNTTWKGEKYMFAMNGQTGKFVGDLPVDRAAFTKWFLGLGAGISVGIYIVLWLMYTLM